MPIRRSLGAQNYKISAFISVGNFYYSNAAHFAHHAHTPHTMHITPGLGLAIITPRWMEYCMDESTVSKYVQFAVNVFGVDATLPPMEIAREGIRRLSEFLFKTLGLQSSFQEVNIGREHFSTMARKACGGI